MTITFGLLLRLRTSGRKWVLERLGGKTWQTIGVYEELGVGIGKCVAEWTLRLNDRVVDFNILVQAMHRVNVYLSEGLSLVDLAAALDGAIGKLEQEKEAMLDAREETPKVSSESPEDMLVELEGLL